MKDLAKIAALYYRLDASLESDRVAAVEPAMTRAYEDQILNDEAYFLLGPGQLETEIDSTCRTAIRHRSLHSDRQVRRSWYLYNPDDKRPSGLSFEDRAALVLDRAAGRGSPYAKAMEHYKTRNEIAHGELRSTPVDVTAFVQDCYVIQTALHRAAA